MKTILALIAITFSSIAIAQQTCTTHIVTMPDGKVMICTTCCTDGMCNTFCN